MRPKIRGWNEGIISRDLYSVGGSGFKKGDVVRYRRFKTMLDEDGHKWTEYEWYYVDTNNYNLVRTIEKIIEGEEYVKEPYLY